MKVLMQSRVDLFSRRGGDTVQIEKTAEELRRRGLAVEINCSARLNLSDYDLVHLFNLDWPAQIYLQARNARSQGKPIVLSPIHHSFAAIERYERKSRYGLRRIVNRIFHSRESREKLKEIYRMLTDPRKIPSTLVELRRGIGREQLEILKRVNLVLVQTRAEAEDLSADFGLSGWELEEPSGAVGTATEGHFRWMKVVNGVDARFAETTPDWFLDQFGLRDFVLSVGRIEPRKNQLAVIEAVARLRRSISHIRLILVGRISWRHPEYALRFRRAVASNDWIFHIPYLPYERMGSVYAASRVHVLASWFETTGLVNLEAGLSGANVVASEGRAREYLLDFAEYCDPGDTDSIAQAITRAWNRPVDSNFRRHILRHFTWEVAAQQTLAAYRLVTGTGQK